MGEALDTAKRLLANQMDQIRELLPEEFLITLVCRHPDDEDAYILLGNDKDLDAVVSTIETAQVEGQKSSARAHHG